MARSPFGERLRKLRREADLNLVDLAEALGLSVAYVSAIERGERQPPDSLGISKMLRRIGRPDLLRELCLLAAKSRRSVEINLKGADEQRVDMLAALARRTEDGTLSDENVRQIMKILLETPAENEKETR